MNTDLARTLADLLGILPATPSRDEILCALHEAANVGALDMLRRTREAQRLNAASAARHPEAA